MTDVATKPEISTGPELKVELTIDAEVLREAQRHVGSESIEATVNEALRRLVEQERERRLRAFDNLQRMAAEGLIDFDAIERSRK
jgi:Arc/MetJ family transcription regulator